MATDEDKGKDNQLEMPTSIEIVLGGEILFVIVALAIMIFTCIFAFIFAFKVFAVLFGISWVCAGVSIFYWILYVLPDDP